MVGRGNAAAFLKRGPGREVMNGYVWVLPNGPYRQLSVGAPPPCFSHKPKGGPESGAGYLGSRAN